MSQKNELSKCSYRPFGLLRSNDFDNIFRHFFNDSPFDPGQSSALRPNLNIRDLEGAYLVEVELPGVEEKDIHLTINKGHLVIEGEKHFEEEGSHYVESSYGKFKRIVKLPDTVSDKDVSANFKHGVLKVSLKKIEEKEELKRIPVSSE